MFVTGGLPGIIVGIIAGVIMIPIYFEQGLVLAIIAGVGLCSGFFLIMMLWYRYSDRRERK